MAKINIESLNKRIEELKEQLSKSTNDKEKAFLIRSIEYKQAIIECKPSDEIEELAKEVKTLKNAWLEVKPKRN